MLGQAKGITAEPKATAEESASIFSRSEVPISSQQQYIDLRELEYYLQGVSSDRLIATERPDQQRHRVIWPSLNILPSAVQGAVSVLDRGQWKGLDIRFERLHRAFRQGAPRGLQWGLTLQVRSWQWPEFIGWSLRRYKIDANEQHIYVLREGPVGPVATVSACTGGSRSQAGEATLSPAHEHPRWEEEIHSRPWPGWDAAPLRRGKLTIKYIL